MTVAKQAISTPVIDRPIRTVANAGPQYNISVGYLRAFVTLLVLAHHSVLAYLSTPPPPPKSLLAQPRLWQAFPISDGPGSGLFDAFAGFNDTFFMSLMFFLSGLFVWSSLSRKGAGQFIRDRALRLGIPFVGAALIIAPLAYYPTYLQVYKHSDVSDFVSQWLALGNWPAGPAWFVWVLLAFGIVAAALYKIAPHWGDVLGQKIGRSSQRPLTFFAMVVAISAIAYIPMATIFNPAEWTSVGPFTFQTSRILHYFAYFMIGAAVGAFGLERGLLAADGKLARRWYLWIIAAVVFYVFAAAIFIVIITTGNTSKEMALMSNFSFVLSCAASSFMCLAMFLRFVKKANPLGDSLRDNAYGMYLIHYSFASWLQYALLTSGLPALVKGIAVTFATIALTWMATAAVRRIPAVRRVL